MLSMSCSWSCLKVGRKISHIFFQIWEREVTLKSKNSTVLFTYRFSMVYYENYLAFLEVCLKLEENFNFSSLTFIELACIAWRFWLIALNNKGGRG